MFAEIAAKVADKSVELATAGLVAVVGWGIVTSVDVAKLKEHQAETSAQVTANTRALAETGAEQRVTNERLNGVLKELQGLREDVREDRRLR